MSADEGVVSVSEVRRLEERVRELERLFGRKTMEAVSGSGKSSRSGILRGPLK